MPTPTIDDRVAGLEEFIRTQASYLESAEHRIGQLELGLSETAAMLALNADRNVLARSPVVRLLVAQAQDRRQVEEQVAIERGRLDRADIEATRRAEQAEEDERQRRVAIEARQAAEAERAAA